MHLCAIKDPTEETSCVQRRGHIACTPAALGEDMLQVLAIFLMRPADRAVGDVLVIGVAVLRHCQCRSRLGQVVRVRPDLFELEHKRAARFRELGNHRLLILVTEALHVCPALGQLGHLHCCHTVLLGLGRFLLRRAQLFLESSCVLPKLLFSKRVRGPRAFGSSLQVIQGLVRIPVLLQQLLQLLLLLRTLTVSMDFRTDPIFHLRDVALLP